MKDDPCARDLGFAGHIALFTTVMLFATTSMASPPPEPTDHLPSSRGDNGAVAIDLFMETWPPGLPGLPGLPGREENLEYFLKQLGSVATKGSPIDSIQDPPIDWPIDWPIDGPD